MELEEMNLIPCAEDCLHQREGYCALHGSSPVSATPRNGCSYYQSRQSNGEAAAKRTAFYQKKV